LKWGRSDSSTFATTRFYVDDEYRTIASGCEAVLVACASIDRAGVFATGAAAVAGVAEAAAVLLAGTIVTLELCGGKAGGMAPFLDLLMKDNGLNEQSSFLKRPILDTTLSAS
jgi:hypothetical protein